MLKLNGLQRKFKLILRKMKRKSLLLVIPMLKKLKQKLNKVPKLLRLSLKREVTNYFSKLKKVTNAPHSVTSLSSILPKIFPREELSLHVMKLWLQHLWETLELVSSPPLRVSYCSQLGSGPSHFVLTTSQPRWTPMGKDENENDNKFEYSIIIFKK